jgi:predicted Zn-dependent peptidase
MVARRTPASTRSSRSRRAGAGAGRALPFSVAKTVLDNGLRVVTVDLPHLHAVSLVVYAKVGSRYETPRDNGLSHFLEHMLFRGTRRHPSSYALNWAIESLGGTLHAETGRDYSLYQVTVPPAAAGEGLAILGDLLGAPRLVDIELERQIILEEVAEDLDERGRDINLDDKLREVMFPGHGLGQKITGPRQNVRRFTTADVRRHLRHFYGAKNLVLCVSGPLERRVVARAARRAFGGLPAGRAVPTLAPAELAHPPRPIYVDVPGAQTTLELLFRALPEADPDTMALQALSRVLDDGMSTRLHYTLCDQKGLAYYVSAGLEPFHDTALFEVHGAASHGKFAALTGEALALLDDLRAQPVRADELAKAKHRYENDLHSLLDDPDAMAGWFGGTELFYQPPTLEEKVARMDAVSAVDVQRVANRVLQARRLVAGASGGLSARQRARFDRIVTTWR